MQTQVIHRTYIEESVVNEINSTTMSTLLSPGKHYDLEPMNLGLFKLDSSSREDESNWGRGS